MKKEENEKIKSLKLQLTDWLYKEYNLTFLPQYFFVNLDKIYKGTYKNLTQAIPVEELFDMWQRKMDYLNKTAEYNKSIGKEMEGVKRVNYDLAILLSKYDSYRNWKSKQDAIHSEIETIAEYNSGAKTTKISQLKHTSDNDDDDNLSSIIDEI